jgi:hypothetical protein
MLYMPKKSTPPGNKGVTAYQNAEKRQKVPNFRQKAPDSSPA